MKKKTVITTEKREVWVIREGMSEAEKPNDIGKVIELPSTVADSEPGAETENLERNNEP